MLYLLRSQEGTRAPEAAGIWRGTAAASGEEQLWSPGPGSSVPGHVSQQCRELRGWGTKVQWVGLRGQYSVRHFTHSPVPGAKTPRTQRCTRHHAAFWGPNRGEGSALTVGRQEDKTGTAAGMRWRCWEGQGLAPQGKESLS